MLTGDEKLDAIGDDAVIVMIESGRTQREIAAEAGVDVTTLNQWLHRDEKRSARVKLAMSGSAEAWLDRGLETIASALSKESGIDSNAAKAYAQECARRAAIRNPHYRDKADVALTGANGGPVETVSVIKRILVKPSE